jgi:DNA modification methylase
VTPYYQDDSVTIYHGDALELLPQLPQGRAMAVVTDPPYIIGAVSAGNLNSKSGGWADMMNSALWYTAWYQEIARILRGAGSFWTFLNWRTVPVVMRAATDARLPITSLLVWDKDTLGPGGPQGLRPSYELVALMAQPQFVLPDRGVSDVWRFPRSYKYHGHPAEKPEPLVRRILAECQMDQGAVVLDPFLGSGTTAAAAKSLGLRCIGIEAEESWCEVAARRCAQEVIAA